MGGLQVLSGVAHLPSLRLRVRVCEFIIRNSKAMKIANLLFIMLLSITVLSCGGEVILNIPLPSLHSIEISPINPTIQYGCNYHLTATGIYSNNSSQDITTSVKWSSSNTSVATISNVAGSNGLASALGSGSATITATSGGISASTTVTVTPAELISIAVTPASPNITTGYQQQFTATGTYSDNSSQNVTTSVTWSSSNTSVATISNVAGSNGLASALGSGSATITATAGGISGSTIVTVTPAVLISIAVTPASPNITTGYQQQFTATGTYSDNSSQNITTSVTWSSSNTSVATISNAAGSNGLAAAAGGGATIITATSGSISGSTTVTATATATVDLWQTFDFPTLNATDLAAHAHTTLGSWNIDNVFGDASTSNAGENTAPAVFNGISDSGGSEGLAYANNGAEYRHGTVQYVFDTPKKSFTTGFWLYVPSGMTGFYGEHDILCINTVYSGTDTYLKIGDPTGSEMRLRSFIFYTSNNTGIYSTAYVALPQDAWYWIAVDYRNNDRVVADVYDASLAFVGSVNHASDGATPNDEIVGMWIGSLIGASEDGMSGTLYWDDWVINWTNPKHPIGLAGD
jgi:uncharacterized protein YjdB